jgi:hypothetical protein
MFFKPISEKKLRALTELYATAISKYTNDEKAAQEMIGLNNKPTSPETAALVVVANAMLNLDEWVNKN